MFPCNWCGETLPASEWYYYKKTGKRVTPCKKCSTEKRRINRNRDHADYHARARRDRYGLTSEEFYALIEAQDGRCAICRSPNPHGRGGWHVDHDHSCCAEQKSCGKCVRGLLCHHCNVGLGMFKDNVASLLAAASYLEESSWRANAEAAAQPPVSTTPGLSAPAPLQSE